jgi:hypothetical protein
VHNDFRVYCQRETNGDYTQGIKQLLEQQRADWKYEVLYEEILALKRDLAALHDDRVEEDEQDLEDTF